MNNRGLLTAQGAIINYSTHVLKRKTREVISGFLQPFFSLISHPPSLILLPVRVMVFANLTAASLRYRFRSFSSFVRQLVDYGRTAGLFI